MALTNKLSAIGDAIREKTGKTELLTLDAMPLEIASIETGGGGDIEVEPIVLTGNCSYACSGAMASRYIELFGDTVSTEKLTNCESMFKDYKLESIPFDINISANSVGVVLNDMYYNCNNLKTLPKIPYYNVYNISRMFYYCYNLREIPEDYFDGWDFTDCKNEKNQYYRNASYMFGYCNSLRKIPLHIFENMNPVANYNYTYFNSLCDNCYVLDELVNMPVPYTATYTSNIWGIGTFQNCYRLKNLTLQVNEDGSPLVKQWKSQTINLSLSTGWANVNWNIIRYNSGITADKEVKDDATYQALKNDPDWFSCDINYSRYNHDSAVNTINTLPDTSAYLATAGGTNTIKFKGAAGAKTDGGAINTLTAEEIAVATAKGWTVSFY